MHVKAEVQEHTPLEIQAMQPDTEHPVWTGGDLFTAQQAEPLYFNQTTIAQGLQLQWEYERARNNCWNNLLSSFRNGGTY